MISNKNLEKQIEELEPFIPQMDDIEAQAIKEEQQNTKDNNNKSLLIVEEKKTRKWLSKHGKDEQIKYTYDELRHLRKIFDTLDLDLGGDISADELYEPLMGLGIAQSKEDVDDLVSLVDEDGSGAIDFNEFLNILSDSGGTKENKRIRNFFKNLINGRLCNELKAEKKIKSTYQDTKLNNHTNDDSRKSFNSSESSFNFDQETENMKFHDKSAIERLEILANKRKDKYIKLNEFQKSTPFHLMVINQRRTQFLNGFISHNKVDKEKGEKMLTAYDNAFQKCTEK